MKLLSVFLGFLIFLALGVPTFSQSLHEIRTEKVLIVFSPGDEAVAQEIATFADEVTSQLTEILDYTPTELIPVLLRGERDQANGYYTIGPRRVVLFVSPDTTYPGYFGPSQSWLRLVFTHELVHYIQLSKPLGLPGLAQTIFGEAFHGAFGAGAFPGWFVEGTAVYLETFLTQGGRGRSGAFLAEILASLYDLDSWTYDQAAYDSLDEFDSRIYRSGYILIDYLVENYGFSLVNELQEAVWTRSSEGGARGFDEHLARLTGLSNDELWSRARRATMVPYWSQIGVIPGVPWEGWNPEDSVFPRPSLPETLVLPAGSKYILNYRDAWNPPRLVGDSKDLGIIGIQDFALSASTLVFTHREYPIYGQEPSHSTTRVYLQDIAGPKQPVPLTPKDGPDFKSPSVALDSSLQPWVYALERRGSTHALVQLTPDARTLYFAQTRLGSARISPDGQVVALTEHHNGYSRLIFVSPHTGGLLPSSTPWVQGSWEFPRWRENDGVAVVLDYEGTRIGLWVPLDSPSGHPFGQYRVIARDPVGVMGVMILKDGRVLYRAPRSKSIQLLIAGPLGKDDTLILALPAFTPDSAHPSTTLQSAPLHSVATFRSGLVLHSWTPTLNLRSSAFGTRDFFLDWDLALGAVLFFGNLAENQNSIIQTEWYSRSAQPVIDLTYSHTFGPRTELGLRLGQNYESRWVQYPGFEPLAEARQTSAASIQWAQVLGRHSRPGWTTEFRSNLELSGRYLIEGRREFSLADSLSSTRSMTTSFPGTSDPEVLIGRSILGLSTGVSVQGWAPRGLRHFYGGPGVSASLVGRVEPDLEGLTDGVPSLIAQSRIKTAVPGPFRILGTIELGITLANNLEAPSFGGPSGSFSPSLGLGDGRLLLGAGISRPLFFPEFSLGSLVVDKVGLSMRLEWGATLLARGIRSAAHETQVVARYLWAQDTGSAFGAPATLSTAQNLPSWTRAEGFYADSFFSLALTIDLGVGAWAGERPLLQAGVDIKIPLSSVETPELAPVFLMDLGDLL